MCVLWIFSTYPPAFIRDCPFDDVSCWPLILELRETIIISTSWLHLLLTFLFLNQTSYNAFWTFCTEDMLDLHENVLQISYSTQPLQITFVLSFVKYNVHEYGKNDKDTNYGCYDRSQGQPFKSGDPVGCYNVLKLISWKLGESLFVFHKTRLLLVNWKFSKSKYSDLNSLKLSKLK